MRAAEGVALFRYQAKKWIGSFAAAFGGLDTLLFAGGIGENAPLVRTRICKGLSFLDIELCESRNMKTAGVISTDASRATVRVMRADEEQMSARSVCRALGLGMASGKRNSDHATKYISRLDPFSADGIPMIHGRGDQPFGLYLIAKPSVPPQYWGLQPRRSWRKRISQTRCQPDANSEQK